MCYSQQWAHLPEFRPGIFDTNFYNSTSPALSCLYREIIVGAGVPAMATLGMHRINTFTARRQNWLHWKQRFVRAKQLSSAIGGKKEVKKKLLEKERTRRRARFMERGRKCVAWKGKSAVNYTWYGKNMKCENQLKSVGSLIENHLWSLLPALLYANHYAPRTMGFLNEISVTRANESWINARKRTYLSCICTCVRLYVNMHRGGISIVEYYNQRHCNYSSLPFHSFFPCGRHLPITIENWMLRYNYKQKNEEIFAK